MKINWKAFKKDPHFFLKYFFVQMIASCALVGALLGVGRSFDLSSELALWHLFLVPLAIVLGIQLPAILHNAVHCNLRPRYVNDLVGEAVGLFVLFGLGPFRISHFLHHAFADSEWDTHPPGRKGFWRFLATTQVSTILVIRRKFLEIHGDNWKNHAVLFVEMGFYYVSLVMRVGFWFLLLGPEWFLVFYLPAYLTNVLVFAHINFATHATDEAGTTTILNLNHNWYYKLVNFLGSGVYFHANHHRMPNLYNPMRR